MIRTESLTKRYGGVVAVDRLSVAVPAGSVVGVLGPNGAGKTTLFRLLLGLVRPTSGGGSVLGRNLVTESTGIRGAVALVPESKALYPGVSAAAFLTFYTRFFPDADLGGARALLDRWGVDVGRSADELSRGARTKVLLAATLAREAELMLLDEPTEGLDPAAIEDLWAELMARAGGADGAGLVLATHRIDEVERVCDRVVVLDRGRLALESDLDELRKRWRRVLVRTPESGEALQSAPGVVATRARSGVIEATTSEWDASFGERLPGGAEILEVHPMSLREIYLAVVGHER